MFGAELGGRFLVLAVILSIAVTVCSIDHAGSMSGASKHSHGAAPGCVPDLCATVLSKDPSVSGKTVGVFLLLSALLVAGPSFRLTETHLPNGVRLLNADHLPRASNKLYRLHAVYLL